MFTNGDKLKELICKKCGWSWVPRVKKPAKCPACQSRKWNKNVEHKKDK